MNDFFKLECPVQHYSWGHFGDRSRVAQLVGREQETELAFAELWVGAHSSNSAKVRNHNSESLNLLIQRAPKEILGSAVNVLGSELPFLLKVLSVRTALSIQAHPDRSQAPVLHRRDPKNYPDSHHKPEMAIALTNFEFLHGFRPVSEIRGFLDRIPEFRAFVGDAVTQEVFSREVVEDEAIAKVFGSIMSAEPEVVAVQSRRLVARLSSQVSDSPEFRWICQIAADYPEGDVGLFCFFVLNYETLLPGDAIFIPANVPHAYLSGDIIECMANSDNVVRAGLTRKYRDVPTLVGMLDYSARNAQRLNAVSSGASGRRVYPLPISEFSLETWEPEENIEFEVGDRKACEIILVLEGGVELLSSNEKLRLETGESALIPAHLVSYTVRATPGHFVCVGVPGQR